MVNELIHKACEAEVISRRYRRYLATQLDSLHRSISFQGHDPANDLCNFVLGYIRITPAILECVNECSTQSGTQSLFHTSFELSLRYFTQPSELVSQYAPIASLLIRSYQCHRLIEELYDNNKSLRNKHLHDARTTQANLLAHHLIGEQLANDIDNSTYAAFSKLVSMPEYYDLDLSLFLERCKDEQWSDVRKEWLELLPSHGICMKLLMDYNL